jgi:hypothetical protein
MDIDQWHELIKQVGKENDYVFESKDLYIDRHHAVAYYTNVNKDTGYIEISEWQPCEKEQGTWEKGRAVYSLRSLNDVIQFCNILVSGQGIRAKRR